jgi:hypothetical protein
VLLFGSCQMRLTNTLAVLLFCVILMHAETDGRVRGTVVDQQGQPVQKADVCTLVVHGSGTLVFAACVQTGLASSLCII